MLLLAGLCYLAPMPTSLAQTNVSPRPTTDPAAPAEGTDTTGSKTTDTASTTTGTADTDLSTTDDTDRNGRVLDAAAPPETTDDNFAPTTSDLSPEIRLQLEDFRTDRDRYLAEYKRLLERLRHGATEEERREFRRQFRQQLRDRWQRISEERKEQGKDRLPALRRKALSLQEVLENAREQARESLQDQERRRPGVDN